MSLHKIINLVRLLAHSGPRATWLKIRGRVARRSIANKLRGKTGLEIGGPSGTFRREGLIQVYPLIESLDNCNFAQTTLWEGTISEGKTFQFEEAKTPGRQFILEASNLETVQNEVYDF